jgi:hypothetical protein
MAGIRDIKTQAEDLESMKALPGVAANARLMASIEKAKQSTLAFSRWLEDGQVNKTGPSGIGMENYTWYQQNVHLVPMSWEEEVQLLTRELGRAWANLKLEEERNRGLPELADAKNETEYQSLAEASASSLLRFLANEEMVSVAPYFDTALRAQLGRFVPHEKRNFFWITAHLDPRPLFSHFYHWFELARLDHEPAANPFRQWPLLYNIFDSRNEGLATAVEEWWMQAGLYDDSPRSRELVYILIAQRAARGLGSLYAHANKMSMEHAGGIHSAFTPRGWMKTEPALRIFEQHLYLRQPGYGTSYLTGKYLLENLMAAYAQQLETKGQPFKMKSFMDALNKIGCIPVQLVGWELMGSKEQWSPALIPRLPLR